MLSGHPPYSLHTGNDAELSEITGNPGDRQPRIAPESASWPLEAESQKRRLRRLRGHTETIGERFERDRAAMLPMPVAPYEACDKLTAGAHKEADAAATAPSAAESRPD